MKQAKKYTVNILLNKDGSKVLLLKKDRTAFAGKWNGVGGKIEDGETPEQGAYREILEETSLRPEDIKQLTWLGTLSLPEQCDTRNSDMYPELWFFAGIVENENLACKPDISTEEIEWFSLHMNTPIANFVREGMYPVRLECAGDGDLQYFIGRARRMLCGKK